MKNTESKPHALQRRFDRIVLWFKWSKYLRKRGWKKDANGWYRSFNTLLPPTATFYREPRHLTRNGIDFEEAVKLARNSDPDDSYIYR